MSHQDAMLAGKCPDCATGVLSHGPWSQEQMQFEADDYGMPVADFYDTCDDCFVKQVAGGDAVYAQTLVTEKLQLTHGAALQ